MSNININVQGSPADMVPKKVNLFIIQTNDNGVMLDCLFNTKQVGKNNSCPAYLACRLMADPADLKSLADSIYEHLNKTGYIEH